jgi:hypothetical protein
VWLLIALPLTAVVAGFTTLWLAIQSDDGLVADDYYKRGKEINRELSRDRAAAELGLVAKLEINTATRRLAVKLSARANTVLPEQIELKFLHATRAGLDRTLILPRQNSALYETPIPNLPPGRWHLQLAAQDWRLTGSIVTPTEASAALDPELPGS